MPGIRIVRCAKQDGAGCTSRLRQFGYDQVTLEIGGLSGTDNNAREIRDAIMQVPARGAQPDLVLIGYSRGVPDILQAVVSFPEIRPRIAAVVSAAGSVGGSPFANDAEQSQLRLLTRWPGARCSPGDGGAVESLRPATRNAWLAENALLQEIRQDAGRHSDEIRPHDVTPFAVVIDSTPWWSDLPVIRH